AMAEATKAGVVIETGLGRWSFSHALVREAFTLRLEPSRQAEVHRRAGEAIEALNRDDLASHYTNLAHHFFWSVPQGDAEKAVEYCSLAGERAMSALAFEEAAELFANALEAFACLPGGDRCRRYELLMSLARARFCANEFAEARQAYVQAFKLAGSLGSGELLARAALGFVGYRFESETGIRMLEEALAALPEEDGALRAEVLLALAGALVTHPDQWRRWRALSDQGLAMTRRVGDPAEVSRALLWWHRLQLDVDSDSLETRLAAVDEAMSLMAKTDDHETLFWLRAWHVSDLFEAGQVESAAAELDRAAHSASALRLPYLIYAVRVEEAGLAMFRGKLAESERLAVEALAAGERTGSTDAEAIHGCQLVAVRRHQGRFDEVAELARRSRERLGSTGGTHFWSVWRAHALAESGRRHEAQEELAEPFPVARLVETLSGNRRVNCAADLAELYWVLDDAEPASLLYELLSPYPERHLVQDVAVRSLGSSSRHLGQLAALLGRWEEADAHFDAAHRHHSWLGTPLWLSHGLADHARMLLARARAEDRGRAADLLARARSGYRALGMEFYERRAAALIEDLSHSSPAIPARLGREGDRWIIEYEGTTVWVADSKGLRYLAALVRDPGHALDAVELIAAEEDPPGPERARLRVTKAIRSTVDRLAESHPALGEHLKRTVRTGTRPSYVPDAHSPVTWTT
ncbi:MAG: hypothetical protein M3179_13540, partial [Actinomycetota bacterium]|nr:hypothetical protein [Actinomycetota bacterium]